jgi:hypothetical protein
MNKNIVNANSGIYLDYGYLMFPLSLNIVPKIIVGPKTFFFKDGYHVSLLRLRDLPEPDQEKVLDFTQKYPVKLNQITGIYRLVTEGDRQSIIVRVRLQGLKKLIIAINHRFGYSFVYPPTHITLFTLKDMEGGIGINSTREYRQLTHQINQKGSQRLAKSFKLI